MSGLRCRDRVELGPKALKRWPEMARYSRWVVVSLDFNTHRDPWALVTVRGLAGAPPGWHSELGPPIGEITAPPSWFQKVEAGS